MHVRMRVCMYVCMCVCMYVWISVSMDVYLFISMRARKSMDVYGCTCVRVCMYACMYVSCICRYVTIMVLCALVVERCAMVGICGDHSPCVTPRRWSWVDLEIA